MRWLCGILPAGHRLFPLMRPFVPRHGLIAIPFAQRCVLYPAAWVGRYSMTYVLATEHVFPERRLFQQALAGANPGAVIDVGANLGVYVLLVREVSTARVIAFEPSPIAYHLLLRTLAVNGLDAVEVRAAACGDSGGTICLQEGVNSYIGAGPTAERGEARDVDDLCRQAREAFTSRTVPQVTLDQQLSGEAAVGLIKIDCEGYEFRVLKGAQRTLETLRPTLFIELHPELIRNIGDTPEDVVTLLERLSYRVECWTFHRTHQWTPKMFTTRPGHRYDSAGDMLRDAARTRPQQVYVVARPAECS